MNSVLIVGDGPLACEMAALIEQSGHTATTYLFNQRGREVNPLARFPALLQEMADRAEIVVEAVVGSREAKQGALRHLSDAFVGTMEPILTTTLNASASEVGGWVVQPENVVGWAALPPLSGAKVFELMPGLRSDPGQVEAARQFLASLNREPIMVGDTAGGVLPRIVANLITEAAFALTEQIAAPEDIDQAMKLGTNHPHGPLAWGDLIGLDQVMGILAALGEAYGSDKYHAAPLLRQLVLAGHWGRRTGRGFYAYADEATSTTCSSKATG